MKIIHCPTKKEFIAVVKKFFKEGVYFTVKDEKIFEEYWDDYNENTCVDNYGKELYYSSIELCKEEFPNTPITEAKDFLKPEIPLWRKLKEFRFNCGGEITERFDPVGDGRKRNYQLNDTHFKQLANYIKRNV